MYATHKLSAYSVSQREFTKWSPTASLSRAPEPEVEETFEDQEKRLKGEATLQQTSHLSQMSL